MSSSQGRRRAARDVPVVTEVRQRLPVRERATNGSRHSDLDDTRPRMSLRATVRRVSLKAIERGWNDLVRPVVASIRTGKVSAVHANDRLGSAAIGDPLHRAADHLGGLL